MRAAVVVGLLAVTACSAPVDTAPIVATLPDNVTSTSVTIGAVHAKRLIREDAKAEVLFFGDSATGNLATLPVNMLMIDGAVTSADALAAADWLKKDSTLPIIVHGFGASAAIAAEVAGTRDLPGLVLEGPPAGETLTRILGAYRGSILFIVGEKDRTTPVTVAAKLHDDAGVSPWKKVVVPAGRKHGDAMLSEVAVAAYRELVNYIAR
jgi:acetyl esterase/lipase